MWWTVLAIVVAILAVGFLLFGSQIFRYGGKGGSRWQTSTPTSSGGFGGGVPETELSGTARGRFPNTGARHYVYRAWGSVDEL